ncbi:MAG: hypothetical protein HUU56_11210 [Bdellovibrionaceae bacterium]|nr:hypothetical protein [Pseudobdellovibrionaceae bacterium]
MAFSPRKIIWKIVDLIPEKIRSSLIRDSLDIDKDQLKGIEIRVAKSQNEINQAFRLLHESYVSNGLMDSKEHELRITKYHCLPTSLIIVALQDGKVIGTVTHVLDSQLGLPSDSAIDLSEMRKKGNRIAEVSSLAVRKGFRRSHALLFALTRYMFHYAHKIAGVDYWIIGVRDNVASYYEAIFFFKRFKTKKIAHGFVKDSPSYFLYMSLGDSEEKFLRCYNSKPLNKNLYHFYFHTDFREIGNYDQFKYNLPINYCFDRDSFTNYFREKERIIDSLSDKEKFEVLNAYIQIYPEFFEEAEMKLLTQRQSRNGVRYLSHYEIEILSLNQTPGERKILVTKFEANGFVMNFSSSGLLVKLNKKVNLEGEYILRFPAKIPIDKFLRVKVIRNAKENHYSFMITEVNDSWKQFILNLEQHIYTQAQSEKEFIIKKAA